MRCEPLNDAACRSRNLLDRRRSLLLVIDMQDKLLPGITGAASVQWNVRRLLDAAALFQLPAIATEQYPERLGPTVEPLREGLSRTISKRVFSCRECMQEIAEYRTAERNQVVLCGIESHVCILHSALDLLAAWDVYVVIDAIGARHALDHTAALGRMAACGAVLTTVEAVLFEWCDTSLDSQFKAISQLVRSHPPQMEK